MTCQQDIDLCHPMSRRQAATWESGWGQGYWPERQEVSMWNGLLPAARFAILNAFCPASSSFCDNSLSSTFSHMRMTTHTLCGRHRPKHRQTCKRPHEQAHAENNLRFQHSAVTGRRPEKMKGCDDFPTCSGFHYYIVFEKLRIQNLRPGTDQTMLR